MAKQPSNDVIFVGCDDGHDSIKLMMRRLSDKTASGALTMPAKVVRGSRAISLTGDGSNGGVYQVGDDLYTITDALIGNDMIDTRTIGYPTSDVNRILVHDALIRANLSGKDVRLLTSLPVQDYYRNGTVNTLLIEQKKANIANTEKLRPMAATPLANITAQSVVCEGIAAVYDMAINDDGSDNTDFYKLLEKDSVGVIDIGGKTIDLAVVFLERGRPQIDLARTKSIDFGMLKVAEQIRNEIQISHKLDEISPRMMARVISEGKMSLYGQDQNMEHEIATALSKVMPSIFDRIRAHWGTGISMSSIVVVGGGAYTLATPIKAGLFSHAVFRDEPEYANARGMLKMGMRDYIQNQDQA